jgi:site-specific DNA recombinase
MRSAPSQSNQPRSEIRCAIYTRKSSEEGLEQEFNSLHAQREACQAYIQSQRHEGWKVLPAFYDDGGISGGTLERPALARLLDDIRAKRLDLVVIYKVDRLTRSLADFAKLVEVFNASNVSFVSVTQQFNTATSMGRLTLNMLLSFAQFEREVTGERIRDKIAASKRKGMWMGGNPPLGYDVCNRKLVINEAEAVDVRAIFQAYLEFGSVRALMWQLASLGITTKARRYPNGRSCGGAPLSRGNLYQMLQNATYRGKVAHKGLVHEGEHDAIVDEELWGQVQARISDHRVDRPDDDHGRPSLLTGLLFDEAGQRLSPSHAKKGVRRYRYYVSQRLITATRAESAGGMRLPAGELERLVIGALRDLIATPVKLLELAMDRSTGAAQQRHFLDSAASMANDFDNLPAARIAFMVRRVISRIVVLPGALHIELVPQQLVGLIAGEDERRRKQVGEPFEPTMHLIKLRTSLKRVGQEMRLIVGTPNQRPDADPALVRLLAQVEKFKSQLLQAQGMDISELAKSHGISGAHFTRILRLGFLAPDIVGAVLQGEQPSSLTATKLMADTRLPLDWAQQQTILGFSNPSSLKY